MPSAKLRADEIQDPHPARRWAQLVGAHHLHPHERWSNRPLKSDRGPDGNSGFRAFFGAIRRERASGALAHGLRGSQKRSGKLAGSRGWWAQWWAHLAPPGEQGRAPTSVVASDRQHVAKCDLQGSAVVTLVTSDSGNTCRHCRLIYNAGTQWGQAPRTTGCCAGLCWALAGC